jgi:lipid II:glycine glycyltransferase (peptidoglycan interpeptide bridge formation enzyme)
LTALDIWVRRRGIGYLQATFPSPGRMPPTAGDAVEILENLELPVARPLPELWQLLPKKTRYTVRSAIKDGVKLHWARDESFIEAQGKLLRDTYARQGTGVRPNYPLGLYRALLSKRRETDVHVLYATFEGRIIAAAWLLADARRCYYWDAVTGDEGRRLSANHVLVWAMIRWAQRRGFETIDFVGTARGGRGGSRPGIGHFKRSMGAQAFAYHIVYWYSPFYRLALRIYRSIANLRRRIAVPRRTADGGNR